MIKNLENNKYKNIYLIIFGNCSSKFGSVLFNIILAWWITYKTNSALDLGLISACAVLPTIIFGLFNGVIVDRLNKKNILIICDLISGLSCFLISYVVIKGTIDIVTLSIANFLLGSCGSLFSTTIQSIIPEIVEEKILIKANSVNKTISQIIKVIGPIFAGIIIKNFSTGIVLAFVFNGVSFFISSICEFFLKYEFNSKYEKVEVFKEIKEGLTYIYNKKWLLNLLVVSAVVNFFIAAYNILLPLYFIRILPKYPDFYGYALASEAIGGIIGAFILSLQKNKKIQLNNVGIQILICGLAFACISIPNIIICLISIFTFGMYLTRFNITMFSCIQSNVDKNNIGKVFSFIFLIVSFSVPVGNMIFGIVGNYYINYIFIVSGLSICLTSICFFKTSY